MELRSGFEKVVVASLFSGALLFLSGCGIAGHHTPVASSRVSFGPRCPSCMLTKTTGCKCSPDGWSHGRTTWRPLMPGCSEWIETTDETVEQTDMGPFDGPHDGEPELAPTEDVSTQHEPTFRRSRGASLLRKWSAFWLPPKPIVPLVTPSGMAFPAPERLGRMVSTGI